MSYKIPQITQKTGESRLLNFDHKGNLAEDETLGAIVSFTVTPDPTTTSPALVVGTPATAGSRVQVRASGGQSGVVYTFSGLVDTSFGNRLKYEGRLFIL